MKDAFGGGMDVGFGRIAWKALGAKEYSIWNYIKWFQGAKADFLCRRNFSYYWK